MILNEEDLFSQAIEIENEGERARFLDKSCGGDHLLREKLNELVNIHFVPGKLLDETRDGSIHETLFVPGPKSGDTIGAYKLLEEIGDGGMGVVFMAEQLRPVQRKVALKVIKVGMDTRRVIARFETERQALALMDHPGITKVLDAGTTETGRPFFVMDLVRGQSITDYCDKKQISLKQRLDIFVQVCGAVEHAHQKGIIHRDLKPSNIMVTSNDGVPLPKIIDFGIAKATHQRLTEKTLFTAYGEMIGTPLYMSPEQAEMSESDVDTRSDVYSLGVVLYELVTGSTPFGDLKNQSFDEIRQAIRSAEPVAASTRISKLGDTIEQITRDRNTDVNSFRRFVRGELDWILAKCLARDRNDRYQSAGELARDIYRYLNGETVEAAKPTLRYRTIKFVAKHRGFVTAAAAIVLILCVSTLVSGLMAVRARNAEQLANSRLGDVETERDRAQAAEKRLSVLERQHRELAAMSQAIAMHNANMVKQYSVSGDAEVARDQNAIFVKPISALWNVQPPNAGATGIVHPPGPPPFSIVHRTEHPQGYTFVAEEGSNNIEVVVMADESASQVELLKCLAKVQRDTFGSDDVSVAVTLNHLGDMMASKQDWDKSEQFYREAIEIVEDLSDTDMEYLSEIRFRLVDCLKDKGDVGLAIRELNEFKEEFKMTPNGKKIRLLVEELKASASENGQAEDTRDQ